MSYQLEHLSLFEPLTNPDAREGTSYFELHPKELPHLHACWLPGSLFIQDAAFDFFAECFYSASESFDSFSSQRFGEIEIARLVLELDTFLREITTEPSQENLFSRYASLFTPDIWSEIDRRTLASAVVQCGEKMRGFIQTTTRESKCLWVLGM